MHIYAYLIGIGCVNCITNFLAPWQGAWWDAVEASRSPERNPMPRSQVPRPMQRMVMVTGILTAAGPAGRPALELADAVGFGGTPESRREQLGRLVRDLQSVGVDITNVAEPGQESQWVLRPGDSRIRLAFTPEQQAELARAALLADRDALAREFGGSQFELSPLDIAPPRLPLDVDLVLRAVTARCLLRFQYNGKARVFDPVSMQRGLDGWAVSGMDRGSAQYRTFYLARMSDVAADEPGTAREIPEVQRGGTDPLSWHVDPPLDVSLDVWGRYAADAMRLLGEPLLRGPDDPADWTYRVTNRWAFFARLTELGERVYLRGPQPIRVEFAAFLGRVIV
jgi:predicted DNA-binding transcriptional regulator YafY